MANVLKALLEQCAGSTLMMSHSETVCQFSQAGSLGVPSAGLMLILSLNERSLISRVLVWGLLGIADGSHCHNLSYRRLIHYAGT